MMSPWQPPLGLEGFGSEGPGPIPTLYVVCALTRISEEVRQQLDLAVEVAKAAIREATLEAEDPWEVAVYAPIEHSAPWSYPRLEPNAVYESNAERLWANSDGVIMFGHDGGSYGGGQEFAWAAAMRLPVLYIASRENSTGNGDVSRQVQGTPVDLTVCHFGTGADLREQVKEWLRKRRSALEALARHRAERPQIHSHLHEAIGKRWSSLEFLQRLRVVKESGLHPRRLEALLTDVAAFAAASIEEVTALAATLGVSLTLREDRLPELTATQLAALATAAAECEWAPSRTLALERQARRELAKGGVRRLPLSTPDNWIDFSERVLG